MDIATELAAALEDVSRPGDFATAGVAEILSPSIEVNGVGRIALPVLPAQAKQLVAVAEQVPYGKGPETLLDVSVRRTGSAPAMTGGNSDAVRRTARHASRRDTACPAAYSAAAMVTRGRLNAASFSAASFRASSTLRSFT